MKFLELLPACYLSISEHDHWKFACLLGLMAVWKQCVIESRDRQEREREVHTHWLAASSMLCLKWEQNPQPGYVPWLGIKSRTFWCRGWHYKQLGHWPWWASVSLLGVCSVSNVGLDALSPLSSQYNWRLDIAFHI